MRTIGIVLYGINTDPFVVFGVEVVGADRAPLMLSPAESSQGAHTAVPLY